MLAIFTVLHFLVDGICAAAMAAYAVKEPLLASIVYYFGLYNAIAFGTQWLTGWLFDKKENWIRYAFLFVLLTLGLGTQSALGIQTQTLLLGIGNSVFHVAAGSLVLRRYTTYKELGIFVSSGAVVSIFVCLRRAVRCSDAAFVACRNSGSCCSANGAYEFINRYCVGRSIIAKNATDRNRRFWPA